MSRDGLPGGIVRIDSATNSVADTITLQEGKVADVAADGNGIWALMSGNPGVPEVLRIDPVSDETIRSR